MIPIYQFKIDEIKRQSSNFRSRICGIILYNRNNPHVVRAIRDSDNWNALNDISGSNWPIFSVYPGKEQAEFNHSFSDRHEYMVPLSTLSVNDNNQFCCQFNVSISDLPCFVVFIFDDNGNVKSYKRKISGQNSETVFNNIQSIVKRISEVESRIFEENKQSESVFREVVESLKSDAFWVETYSLFDLFSKIKNILPF